MTTRRICDLAVGDVYKPTYSQDWHRVKFILPNNTMVVEKIGFMHTLVPVWHSVKRPASHRSKALVEIKD